MKQCEFFKTWLYPPLSALVIVLIADHFNFYMFDNNWVEENIATLIGAAATIIAVVITLNYTIKREGKKKEEDYKNKMIYFKHMVSNTYYDIKEIVDNLNIFCEEHPVKPSLHIGNIKYYNQYDLERLTKDIDKMQYYIAYVNYFKNDINSSKVFNDMYSDIDFFHKKLLVFRTDIEDYFNKSLTKEERISELIKHSLISHLPEELSIKEKSNKEINKLIIIANRLKKNDNDLKDILEIIIDPILHDSNLYKYLLNNEKELLSIIKKIKIEIDDIKNYNKIKLEEIHETNKMLQETLCRFEINSNMIRNNTDLQ